MDRNRDLLYAFCFLHGCNPLSPVLVAYYQDQVNVVTRVALLMTCNTAAVVLSELPSGVMADHLGRRATMLLSAGCRLAGLVVLLAGAAWLQGEWLFGGLALAAVLEGASVALGSGTDVTMLAESIELRPQLPPQPHAVAAAEPPRGERAADIAQALATRALMWPVAASLANLVGAWLYARAGAGAGGIVACAWLALVPAGLLVLVALGLEETLVAAAHTTDTAAGAAGVQKRPARAAQCLQTIAGSARLRSAMLFSACSFATFEATHRLRSYMFARDGIDVSFYGIIGCVMFACSFAGTALARALRRRCATADGAHPLVLWCTAGMAGCNLVAAVCGARPLVPSMCASSLLWGLRAPFLEAWLLSGMRAVPHQRATLLSVDSLVRKLCLSAVLLLVAGPLTDAASISTAAVALGLLSGAVVLLPLLSSSTAFAQTPTKQQRAD